LLDPSAINPSSLRKNQRYQIPGDNFKPFRKGAQRKQALKVLT
jgi:hypothetical protein